MMQLLQPCFQRGDRRSSALGCCCPLQCLAPARIAAIHVRGDDVANGLFRAPDFPMCHYVSWVFVRSARPPATFRGGEPFFWRRGWGGGRGLPFGGGRGRSPRRTNPPVALSEDQPQDQDPQDDIEPDGYLKSRI